MSTTLCNCGVHVMADRVRDLRCLPNTPDWAYAIDTYQHYGTAVHPLDCKCMTCDLSWLDDIREDSSKRKITSFYQEYLDACEACDEQEALQEAADAGHLLAQQLIIESHQ